MNLLMKQSPISIIVAMDENRVIGNHNQLPWHLPADLKHFKQLTLDKPVIMGRKTYESIGKPLPQRRNIIISRQADFSALDCEVVASLDAALNLTANENERMIIGGAQIFQAALPMVTTIYLTVIHHSFEGDVFFPALDMQQWRETSREVHQPDEKNNYSYSFITLQHRKLDTEH